jgi:UDP-N-acetylmuramate: L-alanyl-gamma-D-glutamyl-meso-diaminopimelate ligase
LKPLGAKATVSGDLSQLVTQIATDSRAADHVVVMSNGGFGGIHEKLLTALNERATIT